MDPVHRHPCPRLRRESVRRVLLRRGRRRVQETEEGLKGRHTCPRCAAISVRRKSSGVWACRRCGYVFAGGAYRPIVTTSFKREVTETTPKPEAKAEEA